MEDVKERLVGLFRQYIESQEELSEDNIRMMEFLPYLLELQNQKSLVYGRSYCRHEDFSIFLNTERKWDRVSNLMEKAMKGGLESLYNGESDIPTETFVDTVVDLASYSCLWASFIKETRPAEFQKFVESNGLGGDLAS